MTFLLSCFFVVLSFPVFAEEASPVLVELFTSEGCSSCPAADILLVKLDENAKRQNLPIHVVSLHVDYWNHLGWRDPLSSPQFTKRQKAYAQHLGDNVYTPQMVINGHYNVVGSEVDKVQEYINKSLLEPASARLELKISRIDAKEIIVLYELAGLWKSKNLYVTLVKMRDEVNVLSGENMGRKLLHANSARKMIELTPENSMGVFVLPTPPLTHISEYKVIAWLQDPEVLEVYASFSIVLPLVEL